MLRDVAAALPQTMREMDLVARYGGEEFAIILPVTSLADAGVRPSVHGPPSRPASPNLPAIELRVTTSIGVAQISAGETAEQIVQRADAAPVCRQEGRPQLCLVSTTPRTACRSAVRHRKPYGRKLAASSQARPTATACEPQPPADARTLTAFCADLRRRVIECQKFNVPLSLILLDIDEFKPITDGLGTSAQELMLETMGEFLAVRSGDGRRSRAMATDISPS